MAKMNINNGCKERSCLEKGISFFERNNYFCGKLMVDRDFRADQLYHMGKQRLQNAYLHGWGTVCGLKVGPHPNCPNLKVIVNPGLAVDCGGREIFVPNNYEVELESYRKNGNGGNGDKPENLYICLRYMECETELVPVFLDECGCSETCEPNRIRETFVIDVLTGDDFEDGELDGYLFDRIVSTDEVEIDPASDKLKDLFDGTIKIKTQKGIIEKNIDNFGNSDKVNKLLKKINDDTAANVTITFEDGKFIIKAGEPGDVIILEETGEKPFFSGVKIPAFNTDKGNKIIEACPDCKNARIILAEITNYSNVDDDEGSFLDPTHADFKIPAYTIDNFSYRKTLPSVELLNKLMIYNTFKQ
jgi:hypothetical protein